jgi:putative flippase GtrA
MTLEPVDLAPRRAKWLEIVLFLLTGGVAALVNVVSRFLLNPLLGFVPAVIVAYMIGMLVAYVLFRAVVSLVTLRPDFPNTTARNST